jgi:hypothetical protein
MILCLYYAYVCSIFLKFLINVMYLIATDCYCYIEDASSYPGGRKINFNFRCLLYLVFYLMLYFL